MADKFTDYSVSVNVGKNQQSVMYKTDGEITSPYFLRKVYKSNVTLQTPFFIEDISGEENTVSIKNNSGSAPTLTIQKSIDGTTWETMGTTSKTPITATVPANGRLYLSCSTDSWGNNYGKHTISVSGFHNVGGNTMSLLHGRGFTGNERTFREIRTFESLFSCNTMLVSAEDLLLPATTLANFCYQSMFTGCTSLTTAPSILPATKLRDGCYRYMFYDCPLLNSVTCYATDISASNCTATWLDSVSATGTLYTPSSTPWTTGENGIPEGWTRVDI